MKKILEIEGDIEKILHAILDQALKSGGMGMLGHVTQLIQAIKQQEAKSKE